MLCEMCGKDIPVLRTVSIDGATLRVCDRCAKFGTEVKAPTRSASPGGGGRSRPAPKRRVERDIFEEMGDDLADDYPSRIRKARQRLGLDQEELGQRIGEKRSVIQHLEGGQIHPSDKLIGKLERYLEISLTVPRTDVHLKGDVSKSGVTIGDLIDLKGR